MSIAATSPRPRPDGADGTGAGEGPLGVPVARPAGPGTLQLLAEAVADLAGFRVAAISLVREDGLLEVAAVAGPAEVRRRLEGHRTPLAWLLDELAKGEDWGPVRFVPQERREERRDREWGWVADDVVPLEAPDAWHALDLLVAPLYDEAGALRGVLSMDLPETGLRPGPEQRRALARCAAQVTRAVLAELGREELAGQMRLADAARKVVRSVTGEPSLDRVLELAEPALAEGFQAGVLTVWVWDQPGPDRTYRSPGVPPEPPHLTSAVRRVAAELWREQRLTLARQSHLLRRLSESESALLREHLRDLGVVSLLVVPIGVGEECLGCLVLGRREGGHDWSDVEAEAALAVGHDLGSVVLNARALERERRTIEELRELDRYRTRLIATVSHELKNPLTSVLGHLEILDSVDGLPQPVQRSLGAMERGARRMRRVVDDLLLLSRVTDPDTPLDLRPTDLRALVDEAVDLHAVTAARSGVSVEVVDDGRSVRAVVDVDELDRVVSNLLGNAIKYSPDGGTVRLSLRRLAGEIELCVSDEGIGISEEDRERLFEEFYRSSNPTALALPGTGLGLPIVRRIVDRHGGRIEVDSELGRGSTFRVLLPAG